MAEKKTETAPDVEKTALEKLAVTADTIVTSVEGLSAVVDGKATREELTEATEKLVSQETLTAAIEKLNERHDLAEAARKAPNITVEDKSPYDGMGQFMLDVKQAHTRGSVPPERLTNWIAGTGNVGEDYQGGFLVPAEFIRDIFSKDYMEDSIIARCRQFPVQGNTVQIPTVSETSRQTGSRWGGVTGTWLAEAAGKTPTKPTFEQLQMTLHEFAVFGYATNQLLEDSFITFEAFLREAFTSEAQWMIEDSIINGTGVGQPQGIMVAGSLIPVPMHASQAPARTTVITENIVDMYSRMWPPSWPNAVWLVEQSVLPQLMTMVLAVGAGGGATYMPPGGLSVSPYGTLLGRPVIPCEHCQTLGTVGDIILADFSQYGIISKTGAFDTSVHLLFDHDETAFRFTVRIDGQSLWRTAMTPASGGATLSPFLVLAIA